MPLMIVALIGAVVHYLLILAAAGLCRYPPSLIRALIAAGLCGVYVWACMLPGFSFLGSAFWRVVCVLIAGIIAFGRKELQLAGALLVLCLGIDAVISQSGARGTLAGLCAVLLLWLLMRNNRGRTLPVTIRFKEKELALTALQDTGNFLRDPVSGEAVLIVGPEIAKTLTGLTADQLRRPLESIGAIPGLRLIPYKAVGSSGFLLGLKLEHVCVGNRKGSRVVAFAPDGFAGNGRFDALTGGMA